MPNQFTIDEYCSVSLNFIPQAKPGRYRSILTKGRRLLSNCYRDINRKFNNWKLQRTVVRLRNFSKFAYLDHCDLVEEYLFEINARFIEKEVFYDPFQLSVPPKSDDSSDDCGAYTWHIATKALYDAYIFWKSGTPDLLAFDGWSLSKSEWDNIYNWSNTLEMAWKQDRNFHLLQILKYHEYMWT